MLATHGSKKQVFSWQLTVCQVCKELRSDSVSLTGNQSVSIPIRIHLHSNTWRNMAGWRLPEQTNCFGMSFRSGLGELPRSLNQRCLLWSNILLRFLPKKECNVWRRQIAWFYYLSRAFPCCSTCAKEVQTTLQNSV